MRAVIQRVQYANVKVDGNIIGKIDRGFLIFLGVCDTDTTDDADKILNKIIQLRIFEDSNGKSNLSLKDVDGQILIVSQFTLYADCHKGNRPSFIKAGNPEFANNMYEYFLDEAKKQDIYVAHGIFGADMKVELLNEGPFTIILEAKEGKIL